MGIGEVISVVVSSSVVVDVVDVVVGSGVVLVEVVDVLVDVLVDVVVEVEVEVVTSVQTLPSPSNPSTQAQVNEPTLLEQLLPTSAQLSVPASHSSIS